MNTTGKIQENQAMDYLVALEQNASKKQDGRPSVQEVAEQMGVHRSTVYRFTERYIKAGILDSDYRLTEYGYDWLQNWKIKKHSLEKRLEHSKINKNSIAYNVNMIMENCTDDLITSLSNSVLTCRGCKFHPSSAACNWYSVNGENFTEKLGLHMPDGRYAIPFTLLKDNDQELLELSMAHRGFLHPAVLEIRDGEGTIHLTLRMMEQQSASGKWFRGEAGSVRYKMNGEWMEAPLTEGTALLPMSAFWLSYEGEDFKLIRGMTSIRFSCSSGMEAMGEREALMQIRIRRGLT